MLKISNIVLLGYWLLIVGCSSQQLIPDEGDDIKTIYDAHTGTLNSNPRGLGELNQGNADLVGYTRDANNEIRALFPLLPNPELSLYVFPHFNASGRPIPGYSTAFSLYEKNEYALPGEIALDKEDQ